jgi:hypothetical protein
LRSRFCDPLALCHPVAGEARIFIIKEGVSMSHEEMSSRIVAFARHCGDRAMSPESAARARGWIDARGLPTDDGLYLIAALREQDATRTVFRGAVV